MKSLSSLLLVALLSAGSMLLSVSCQNAKTYGDRPLYTRAWSATHQSGRVDSSLDFEAGMQMRSLSRRGIIGTWHANFGQGRVGGATFGFTGDGRFSEMIAGRTSRFGTYTTDSTTTPAHVNIRLSTGAMLYSSAWLDGGGRLRMTKFFYNEKERSSWRYVDQDTYVLGTAPEVEPLVSNTQSISLNKPLIFDWNGTHGGKPVGLSFNGDIGFTMTRNDKVLRGTYLKDANADPQTLTLVEQNGKLHQMYYRLEDEKLILAEGSDEKFADPIALEKRSAASRMP
jgi:hypothetical protein